MKNNNSRMIALLLTILMTASVVPTSSASSPTEDAPIAYGVTYDWQMLDDDIESITAISLTEVLADVSKSADDAGFELLLAEANTGTSSFIIEQYDGNTVTWDDYNGESVELTERITTATLRHGVMVDTAMISEWSDSFAGYEVAFTIDSEMLLNADVKYTEFVDEDLNIYGMDLDMDMKFETDFVAGIEGEIEGDGETMPIDINFDAMINYEILASQMSIVLDQPSTLLQNMSDAEPGMELEWECESHDDDWDGPNYESWYEYDDWYGLMIEDNCLPSSGSYQTAASFEINFDGFPTEDLGFAPGEWDISLKDSVQDTGTFEDYEVEIDESVDFEDSSPQMITIDSSGTQVSAMQVEYVPMPLGMGPMMGMLLEEAFVGSGDNPTLGEAFEDELEDSILGEIFGMGDLAEESTDDHQHYEEDNWFHCDNGNKVYDWQVNNYEDDCGDGSDENVPVVNSYIWEWDEEGISAQTGIRNVEPGNWTVSWQLCESSDEYGNNCQEIASGQNVTETDPYWIEEEENYSEEYSSGNFYSWPNDLTPPENAYACLMVTWHHPEDSEHDMSDSGCSYIGIEPPYLDARLDLGCDSCEIRMDAHNLQHTDDTIWEAQWQVKDEDGTTVHSGSQNIGVDYWWNYEDGIGSDLSEGEYCLHVTVKELDSGAESHSMDCDEKGKDIEPSERLQKIGEAFAESGIGNVMENFGKNLENRMSKYEADIAYEDAMAYSLWDKESARFVGFQFLVESDSNWHTLVGPASDAYTVAPPKTISVNYFVGAMATDTAEEIDEMDTLSELVDITQHESDTEEVIEVVEESGIGDKGKTGDGDSESGGLIPFVSPLATIAVIALAGIAVRLNRRE